AIDFDDSPALSLDLEPSPALDLDLSADFDSPAPPPPRFEPEIAPAVSAEEGGEDLDFITEHLTEAEVFAKYGLAEKVTEHLRAIIVRAPKHLAAHEKLYRLLLDDGDVEGARAAASQYMTVLQEKGDASAVSGIQD